LRYKLSKRFVQGSFPKACFAPNGIGTDPATEADARDLSHFDLLMGHTVYARSSPWFGDHEFCSLFREATERVISAYRYTNSLQPEQIQETDTISKMMRELNFSDLVR
jgi:hypothetical protein